ncbi:MAG: hypothetical protein HXX08_17175 [Chloroflexi bacterium]|uniref:DNA mismatch repair proteins mutS family domain-containing protein n=1 Tax=Candidatus Chlorohelix allophototropha TaxID=3003348 RepID=A0A8T7M652_9CHLR|nr:hypothetical protein [Chloroflexota bacterium]WJW69502.1 hypothetical protein OZ401_003119 [Chloroflexota bacterium L227-S17]
MIAPAKQARLEALQNKTIRLELKIKRLKAANERFLWIRTLLFFGSILLASIAGYSWGIWLALSVLALSLIPFVLIVRINQRFDKSIERYNGWMRLTRQDIARIRLAWSGIPSFKIPALSGFDHPFDRDLDICGDFSLHQLINTAYTQEGSLRLRDWLLQTNPCIEEIQKRQKLVTELAQLTLFRGKLQLITSLNANNLSEVWNGRRLLEWLQRHVVSKSLVPVTLILSGLAFLNLLLLGLFVIQLVPALWLTTFVLYIIIYNLKGLETRGIYEEAYSLLDGLSNLKEVLLYLEKYRYGHHKALYELCQPLLESKKRPSALIKRLNRIVTGIALQRNGVIWLALNAVIPWRYYATLLLGKIQAEILADLPGWLEVWYELEALNSLASFCYLNPEYTFPEIKDSGEPIIKTEGLGHPLIAPDAKVCNDFSMRWQHTQLALITGSNMAGKSSFLRAVGVNLSLAYAGAPVNAANFTTSLFRLYSCIRVSDSVTDGFSYFYAEVRRLKSLLESARAASAQPLFYLIDEIFRGTNNRERLVGSRAYLQTLLTENCMGLVATHDLELVKLETEAALLKNYHFKEDVREGKMLFDFKLRSGPCPTTNALLIMRLEGLPVGED